MKRSKSLRLLAMGAGAFALSACNDEPKTEVGIFESAEQCAAHDGFDEEACEAEFEKAMQEHLRVAPKYKSIKQCQAEYGPWDCEAAPRNTVTGHFVFIPIMRGYMFGGTSGADVATQPLYRDRSDPKAYRTASNRSVVRVAGLARVDPSVTKAPKVNTATVRRAGFGATAASYTKRSSGG